MPLSFRDFWSWGVLALALGLVVLWPGDVSWLMDEPRLIATAWHANHGHRLALGGLYGNFGIRYGPLPTQMYQVLLLLTHDPFALVVLHGLLCAGVTGAALLWLARTLELPGWFAAGVLLSPHVVAYQRVLWDASLAMPVGVLALAALADFLRTGRAWSLRGCVLAAVLLPTIHPQSLPLTASILGWLAWRHRTDLWRDRKALVVVGMIVLLLDGFYLGQFAGQLVARLSGSMSGGYPGGGSHWLSALAPFLGGRLLSGADYLQNLARLEAPGWLHIAGQCGANLIYPLAWLGVALALRRAWQLLGERRAAPQGVAAISPRDAITLVLLAGLSFQALLFGLLRIPGAPQYFFGTFALHVLAALLAVGALRRWKWGALAGVLYVVGAAGLTIEAAWSIHRHGFERPLWPTLAASVGVSRGLNSSTDTTALTDVTVYQKAPQALRTLRLLLPSSPGQKDSMSGNLLITHNPMDPARPGETALTDLGPGVAPPVASQRIDITPLPRDWVPDPSTW